MKVIISKIITVLAIAILFFGCQLKDSKYFIKKGDYFYNRGEFEIAVKNYTKAINVDEKDAEAYMARGVTYLFKLDKADLAFDDFCNVIRNDSNYNWFVYCNRGWLYLIEKQELEKAESDFKRAIKMRPDKLSPYVGLSSVYVKKNLLDSALSNINFVITNNPEYNDFFVQKGMIFYIRGNILKLLNQDDKAKEDLKKSDDIGFTELIKSNKIDTSVKNSDDNFEKGKNCFEQNQYDKAIPYFKAAMKDDKENLDLYVWLCRTYRHTNQTDSAFKYINYVISKDSLFSSKIHERGMIFVFRGFLYLDLKQEQKAIIEYKKAADIGSILASRMLKAKFNIDYPNKE